MKPQLALLLALSACTPKVGPGPVPAAAWQAGNPTLQLTPDGGAVVYLELRLGFGSAYDPPGKEGLANLVAHSLVDAGAGELNADATRQAYYRLGTAPRLVVSREWTSLRLACPAAEARTCISLLTDAVRAPRFTPDDVERLRREALFEVSEGLLGDDEALGDAALHAWRFEGHPYAHPVVGREGALAAISAADVAEFAKSHLVKAAVHAGISGGYTPADAEDLTLRISGLPEAAPVVLPPMPPPAMEGRQLLVVQTASAVTGFHVALDVSVPRTDPDWVPLTVAFAAFGQHRQSFGRLFTSLRGERGLNYGDYAYLEPYRERGDSSDPDEGVLRTWPHASLWLRPTSVENGPFAIKLALDELDTLVADGLNEQEIREIGAWLATARARWARDPGHQLSLALDSETTGTPDALGLLAARAPSLTVQEVREALQRHVNPANLRIVAVTSAPEDLRTALVEGKLTPVVYGEVKPDAAQAAKDDRVAAKGLQIPEDAAYIRPSQGLFR